MEERCPWWEGYPPNTGKVENLHGHVNCNLQYVNLDLHSL